MKAVLVRYGVKDAEFLRNALSPKLKLLGVLSLIPTANELSLAAADKETSAAIQVRVPRREVWCIYSLVELLNQKAKQSHGTKMRKHIARTHPALLLTQVQYMTTLFRVMSHVHTSGNTTKRSLTRLAWMIVCPNST